ncbi:hypothetical protein [Bacillus sp. 123MFChir2]|uniref:hypothetical protein n=1 Tax=Bacillus sp. 123MFChir2 TaxID=1169144 RepID=UPI000382AF10|nr:hypothetical protein [Bacillus sp. 123MFChir2]
MHRTENLRSLSLFVFTSRVAEKNPDRFYAWSDALDHLKKEGVFMGMFKFTQFGYDEEGTEEGNSSFIAN